MKTLTALKFSREVASLVFPGNISKFICKLGPFTICWKEISLSCFIPWNFLFWSRAFTAVATEVRWLTATNAISVDAKTMFMKARGKLITVIAIGAKVGKEMSHEA